MGSSAATFCSRSQVLEISLMGDMKDKLKQKIDQGAEKAKDLTAKGVDKTKEGAKAVGEKVKEAGQRIKDQGK